MVYYIRESLKITEIVCGIKFIFWHFKRITKASIGPKQFKKA